MDNGTTWQKIGGGGSMILDWTNPLHVFSSSGTWTATEDCFIVGQVRTNNARVAINNHVIASADTGSNSWNRPFIAPTGVKQGDVIEAGDFVYALKVVQ